MIEVAWIGRAGIGTPMKRITRTVELDAVRDLLERPPRATLAFTRDGRIDAHPVSFVYRSGSYFFGMQAGPGADAIESAAHARLLIDEGCYHTELRGLWLLGKPVPADPAHEGGGEVLRWFELQVEKTAAWDYDLMREMAEDDGPR